MQKYMQIKDETEFDIRMEEEITAFAKRHNLDYELVAPFAQWVEWYSRQEERKRIKNLIK